MIPALYALGAIAALGLVVWLNRAARRRPPLTPDEINELSIW